jgi:hypothetical protein
MNLFHFISIAFYVKGFHTVSNKFNSIPRSSYNEDEDVSVAWYTEPDFIGRFTMKPIYNNETWDFDTSFIIIDCCITYSIIYW